jgi:hypothetical protein
MVYQGAATGTPLSTTIPCCNGNGVSNPISCYNTGVASPITRTTAFSYLRIRPAFRQRRTALTISLGLVTKLMNTTTGLP